MLRDSPGSFYGKELNKERLGFSNVLFSSFFQENKKLFFSQKPWTKIMQIPVIQLY